MPNCKSFLVTDAERKHVRRRARFSTTSRRELSSSFFFLQGKAAKEIYAILTETLGEYEPSYATVKNWVAQFLTVAYQHLLVRCSTQIRRVC